MATTDVPGANPANGDTLQMGCWAEAKDGSLLLIEGTENENVIYCLFDLKAEPPIQFRDVMRVAAFRALFVPAPEAPLEWTWHDKTPFPWRRVMQDRRPEVEYPSADAQLTAAERLRQRLLAQGRQLVGTPVERHGETPLAALRDAVARLQSAVERLAP